MKRCDVLVCGAGAAGMSAALWLHDYDLTWSWVSPPGEFGGILQRVNNTLHNVLAHSYENGRAYIAAMRKQHAELGLPSPHAASVTRLTRVEEGWRADLDTGDSLQARAVLLATGTTYRKLGVPGEEELRGRFVSQSSTRDGEAFRGKEVAIVGGGDGAFENALILAERFGCQVHLLARSDAFRARQSFVDAVKAHPEITIAPTPSSVTALEERGDRLVIHLEQLGQPTTLRTQGLFVKIGITPVLPALAEALASDEGGYLAVDDAQRTSAPGLYAAGDVTSRALRAVATSAGAGATAAHAIAQDLGIFYT